MNVKYFTVAKDEYEGGSCPVCARCGSNMRHVTSINGTLYGSNCGKIVIDAIRRNENECAGLIAEAAKVIPAAASAGTFDMWEIDWIKARIVSCESSDRADHNVRANAWRAILEAKSLRDIG